MLTAQLSRLRAWLVRPWSWLARLLGRRPTYALAYHEGDELPVTVPERTLVVAREDGELWSAGMLCPCGCGRRLEVVLVPDVKPGWRLSVGPRGGPTLHPSIWARTGCRSHFWLRDGEIDWCRND